MHDTRFTFNSLQQSNVYPSEQRACGRHASPARTAVSAAATASATPAASTASLTSSP